MLNNILNSVKYSTYYNKSEIIDLGSVIFVRRKTKHQAFPYLVVNCVSLLLSV